MPTATGLPQKGERVRYQQVIFGDKGPVIEGTVVKRGTGEYFTLYVRFDGGRIVGSQAYGQKGVSMMVDAAYALKQGWLKVIG